MSKLIASMNWSNDEEVPVVQCNVLHIDTVSSRAHYRRRYGQIGLASHQSVRVALNGQTPRGDGADRVCLDVYIHLLAYKTSTIESYRDHK